VSATTAPCTPPNSSGRPARRDGNGFLAHGDPHVTGLADPPPIASIRSPSSSWDTIDGPTSSRPPPRRRPASTAGAIFTPPRRPSEAHAGIPRAVHTHGRLVEHPYPESAAEAPPQRPLPRLRDRHEDVIATLGACARILGPRGSSCGPARSGRRDELWLGTKARSENRGWRGAKPSHVHGGPCFPPLTRAARGKHGPSLVVRRLQQQRSVIRNG
jgi:hypothetical protein